MISLGAGRSSFTAFSVAVTAFALRRLPPDGAASEQRRMSPSAIALNRSTTQRSSSARPGPKKWVRKVAAAVHGGVPETDGFAFESRFTGDSCVAVFERAFGRLRATGIAEFVRHAEFLEALDDYDIVLTGPPGRAE